MKNLTSLTSITECFIAPSASNDEFCGKGASSTDELILYGAVENRVGARVKLLRKWGADLKSQSNLPDLETGMSSNLLPSFNKILMTNVRAFSSD